MRMIVVVVVRGAIAVGGHGAGSSQCW
jgi:hypothetical protein